MSSQHSVLLIPLLSLWFIIKTSQGISLQNIAFISSLVYEQDSNVRILTYTDWSSKLSGLLRLAWIKKNIYKFWFSSLASINKWCSRWMNNSNEINDKHSRLIFFVKVIGKVTYLRLSTITNGQRPRYLKTSNTLKKNR